ncbi:hypothetical protein Peur_026687 [Populus x canadensis]
MVMVSISLPAILQNMQNTFPHMRTVHVSEGGGQVSMKTDWSSLFEDLPNSTPKTISSFYQAKFTGRFRSKLVVRREVPFNMIHTSIARVEIAS